MVYSPIRVCLRGSYLLVQKVRVDGRTASPGARFLEGPGPRALGAPGGLPSLARSPVPGGPVSLACLSLAFRFLFASLRHSFRFSFAFKLSFRFLSLSFRIPFAFLSLSLRLPLAFI